MEPSKLITDPEKLKLIVSPHTTENKILLRGGSWPQLSKVPVRKEILVLPADSGPSFPDNYRTQGFAMHEEIGISVVNQKAVSQVTMTRPAEMEVFSWPLPGRPDYHLRVLYQDANGAGMCLVIFCGDITNPRQRLVKGPLCTYEEYVGLSYTDNGMRKLEEWPGTTPGEKLCLRICGEAILETPGPDILKLLADSFWQKVIDELPGALLTAEVMFS